MRATNREVMVATLIMTSNSRGVMAINIRVGMEATSSLAMEPLPCSKASTFSLSLGLSSREAGVQEVHSREDGEVLVEARLHLVSTLEEHNCQLTLL